MTSQAQKIISSDLMQWATDIKPITELTGALEHIKLAGASKGRVDVVLVAPCTANTLGKVAAGIDDNAVTTVVSCAIGSKIPVLLALGMHQPLYDNSFVQENLKKLQRAGIVIVPPRIEEGKAKLASSEDIVDYTIRSVTKQDMSKLNVLVTSGPTREAIDPIRIITNRSTGLMGMSMAKEAWFRGAKVTLIQGPSGFLSPSEVKLIHVETASEMQRQVEKELRSEKYSVMVAAAAPGDFQPETTWQTKIPTSSSILNLKLKATPKIIESVKRVSKSTYLIAFKAGYRIQRNHEAELAKQLITDAKADLVAVNDAVRGAFADKFNEVVLVNNKLKPVKVERASKLDIASRIYDVFLKETTR
jgi:phosphopantothenoylcysteine decarboxylase/phosphopantothenate--cysteine ligase